MDPALDMVYRFVGRNGVRRFIYSISSAARWVAVAGCLDQCGRSRCIPVCLPVSDSQAVPVLSAAGNVPVSLIQTAAKGIWAIESPCLSPRCFFIAWERIQSNSS